jgi:hypothetical protein
VISYGVPFKNRNVCWLQEAFGFDGLIVGAFVAGSNIDSGIGAMHKWITQIG